VTNSDDFSPRFTTFSQWNPDGKGHRLLDATARTFFLRKRAQVLRNFATSLMVAFLAVVAAHALEGRIDDVSVPGLVAWFVGGASLAVGLTAAVT
jgi:hypothetical protein